MLPTRRSGCPINLTLEVLGDRWSLIVVRDLMFGDRRRFRELLSRSEEGIASNVLADRRVIIAGRPREVIAHPHPFIREYFLGGRGRRALEALHDAPAEAAPGSAGTPHR